MVARKVETRKQFWEEVIQLAKEKVNFKCDINVSNKSKNENYRFANATYKGSKGILNEQGVYIILSVACEPGEKYAIPRFELMFKDGEDVTRRDMVNRRLKKELPEYKHCVYHTNDDGISKITIRRRKDTTQKFNYKREAEVLVDLIEAVINVLEN